MASRTKDGHDADWLDPDERRTWIALCALLSMLPAEIESQLVRDAGLSFFEYSVLAALSENADRTLPMSQLAALSNGSLSRLSHVARRLEAKGYIRRRPLPEDGRITVATLLEPGLRAIVDHAPDHVATVRASVFDPLTRRERAQLGRLAIKIIEGLDPDVARVLGELSRQPEPGQD